MIKNENRKKISYNKMVGLKIKLKKLEEQLEDYKKSEKKITDERLELIKNIKDLESQLEKARNNLKVLETDSSRSEVIKRKENEISDLKKLIEENDLIEYTEKCREYLKENCPDLDPLEEEIIWTAQEEHFQSLFPEADFFGDKLVFEELPDCLDRDPDHPDYNTCCHKRFARYIEYPDLKNYNPERFTIFSKEEDVQVVEGRVD